MVNNALESHRDRGRAYNQNIKVSKVRDMLLWANILTV
jgi:hypothetical protein